MIGPMTEHNHKKQRFENPVGDDAPFVKFDVPLWQVFVALFLIALVLTAFKLHERRNIAPYKKVQWNSFDLSEFKQERLNRRNILLWIQSADENTNQEVARVFEDNEVQATVYLNRCLTYRLSPTTVADEDLQEWLARNASDFSEGGIGYWMASERKPEVVDLPDVDVPKIVKLVDGG